MQLTEALTAKVGVEVVKSFRLIASPPRVKMEIEWPIPVLAAGDEAPGRRVDSTKCATIAKTPPLRAIREI
jgi:hypothetical protein